MNIRVERETTPEGRLAAAARVAMMRCVQRRCAERKRASVDETLLPDYADFREGIREALKQELLIAELDGLAHSSEASRSRRRDEILRELTAKKS
jgi:hypothetical protein